MATARLDQKSRALVREIPSTFTQALSSYFGNGSIDIDEARAQHQTYRQALIDSGIEVTVIPTDDDYPDCIFVEDQAIVIDGHVLLPIPGHESRRGEQPPVAEFLARSLKGHQVCRMVPPAMMDGGDIIRLGDVFYVGRSTRTNNAGIEELRQLLDHLGHELRVIDVPEKALHLTSISSTPTDEIILAPQGYLSEDAFNPLPEGCKVLWMPEEEVYGCNTIGLPDGKVLVAKGHPTISETLRNEGLEVIELEMSMIKAADGSLTCCSVFH